MSCVTIFTSDFCNGSAVVKEVLDKTGFTLITENNIIAEASKLSGMAEEKIERAFSAKTSVFNKFTHEKENALAYLKMAVAEILSQKDLLIVGYAGLLVPREISHALHVCLVGDMQYRIAVAIDNQGLSDKNAKKMIKDLDQERAYWVNTLYGTEDPWDSSLFDLVIPIGESNIIDAAALIDDYLQKDIVRPSAASKQAVEDFQLASRVAAALGHEGHDVDVKASKAQVTLTINKHVLLLSRLEDELKKIVSDVAGVGSVTTTTGKNFHKTDVYRKCDFDIPSKVLLVDDEREFVQTLSERLTLRDMGSAVAHDGESALELIAEDEPEVLVLDLKMPGLDGIEVLRRVKESRPDVEVIILTGHGSEQDRETCMNLGAFAYMHKPVNIEVLSVKLKEANKKVQDKKRT
ncbi:MAG: response regulator [Desulfobulbaceae bacterium]|nr:response regulator [Desulfobulbaceae bacterium]